MNHLQYLVHQVSFDIHRQQKANTRDDRKVGLNIFYLAFSVHILIHEHIIVNALGLERKQYAYRVLLPNMKHLYNLWRISVHHGISVDISNHS